MPARRSAASTTASAPASPPVWVSAASAACGLRPAFNAITGFSRAAARAAERNLRGAGIVSSCNRMARVAPSMASRSRKSPASASAIAPSDTTRLKPMPRPAAQSTIAAATEPDCARSASRPGAAGAGARLAFSRAPGTTIPKEPGPTTRSRCGRAASSIAWRSGPGPGPRPVTTASRHPRAPSAATAAGSASGGRPRMATSGASASVAMPAVSATGISLPSKPPARMPARIGSAPAPTTATTRGSRMASRLRTVMPRA